jgi:2-amino-4-hydroxy-6-hydroxymethyldihydropteridine diphosphokinase
VVGATQIEETEPLGGLAQPPYLNQMLAIETTLDPFTLLARLHEIEAGAGRVRGEQWKSRTLDLDVVRFGERVVQTDALVIPHPGIVDRAFWQREIAELSAIMNRGGNE